MRVRARRRTTQRAPYSGARLTLLSYELGAEGRENGVRAYVEDILDHHWVPPEASLAYLEVLSAPSKKLVWFERSGHEPFADEPAKFNTAMMELVRPALPSDR